jgi:hypothetical protein
LAGSDELNFPFDRIFSLVQDMPQPDELTEWASPFGKKPELTAATGKGWSDTADDTMAAVQSPGLGDYERQGADARDGEDISTDDPDLSSPLGVQLLLDSIGVAKAIDDISGVMSLAFPDMDMDSDPEPPAPATTTEPDLERSRRQSSPPDIVVDNV